MEKNTLILIVVAVIVLAVLPVIALVSIALLGFFPGVASDARVTQSNSYWRGEARPFAIIDHSISPDGSGTIMLQNNDATGTISVTKLEVGGATFGQSVSFRPGETKSIGVSQLPTGKKDDIYSFEVKIYYTTPNGVAATQFGAKPLVGKYS